MKLYWPPKLQRTRVIRRERRKEGKCREQTSVNIYFQINPRSGVEGKKKKKIIQGLPRWSCG